MIPIFKYEQDAGIAEAVRSSGSIAFASSIKPIDITSTQEKQLQKLLSSSAEANPNQFDLFYLESVLASVGWNQNDDVFDPLEAWAARHTPVDKKFNFMHNETDIIGHLTSSKTVSFDGGLIADDTDPSSLPPQFEIVVGSVLYRQWSDPKLQERMDKIIAEIEADKWCVSMECLFRNFDYAIVTPEGDNKVLARNDETSFLTKHLRVYGGTGEFDGNKVGRLLRGFTFSGKGLVDNPANPRSHITKTDNNSEISSFAGSLTTAEELKLINVEEKLMTISQEQYDAVKAELEALKASKNADAQSELDAVKAQRAELDASIATLTSELEASKEVANAKDETIAGLKTELEEVNTKLTEANTSIEEQKLAVTKATRKAQLLEKVDEDKAVSLVEKFTNASDEMFDALVESLPAKKMEDDEEDKKDKKDKTDCKASEDGTDTDIDEADASDDAEMVTGGDDTSTDKCAKAASWFSQNVLRSTKKEGE